MNLERFLRPGAVLLRFDFRTKLVWLITLSILATLWSDVRLLAALCGFTLLLSLVGGVRGRVLSLLAQVSLPFGLFMLLAHGFFNPALRLTAGGWRLPWPGAPFLARAGLLYGIAVTLRMLSLVWAVPALMLSTPLEALVASLARWRVPYKGVFIFATTLRFVPLWIENAQAMVEAQRLRGIALEKLSWKQRLQLYGGMVVPLILGALMKAQTLDWVLQTRSFGLPQQRTYLHPSRLRWYDGLLLIFAGLLLLAADLAYLRWGLGPFRPAL